MLAGKFKDITMTKICLVSERENYKNKKIRSYMNKAVNLVEFPQVFIARRS